jgi:hypothetical protein
MPDFSVTNCAPKVAVLLVELVIDMISAALDGAPLGIRVIGDVPRVALTKNSLKVSGPAYPCTVGPLAGRPKLV